MRTVPLALVTALAFALSQERVEAQVTQGSCSALQLVNALTTELLRSEAEALARQSKSPTLLGIIKQGAKRAGASAYYGAVAVGAVAVCAAKNIPMSSTPSAPDLKQRLMDEPPGNCGESEHRRLQDDVDKHCGPQSRCRKNDPIELLSQKRELNRQCGLARTRINATCFLGGNAGHRQAADGAFRAQARCEKYISEK